MQINNKEVSEVLPIILITCTAANVDVSQHATTSCR